MFGCERFKQYVIGRVITVESDHKPLIPIMKKSLTDIPIRLQKMRIRLQPFDIDLVYKPGKELIIADALSRAHLDVKADDPDINATVLNVMLSENMSDKRKSEFIEETSKDTELQIVLKLIRQGWPDDKSKIPVEATPYFTFRENLFENDGLLYNNNRVIVPKSLRKKMLDCLHYNHLGMVKTKNRAREILFWPGLSKQIEEIIANCEICLKYHKSNTREELIPSEIPTESWNIIGTDLYYLQNRAYLIVVDYYSKYIEFGLLKDESSETTIDLLKSYFARFGVPKIVRSDNGPQFSSKKFKQFAKDLNFQHVTSSPRYPQSNGFVERQVQTIKKIMKKALDDGKDPFLSLLEFRNTPISNKIPSPNKMLLGKNVRGIFPDFLEIPVQSNSIRNELKKRQEYDKSYYDKKSRNLHKFKKNDNVRIQLPNKTWQRAKVTDFDNSRSYKIKTESGSFLTRNRRFLRRDTDKKFIVIPEKHYDCSLNTNELNNHNLKDYTTNQNVADESVESPNIINDPIVQKRSYIRKKCNLNPRITKSGRNVEQPLRFKDYDLTF